LGGDPEITKKGGPNLDHKAVNTKIPTKPNPEKKKRTD